MLIMRYIPAALILSCALAAAPFTARAAESYDNCTGFITTLPTTINTQGTWCLDQDLSTAITSGEAVTIAADNVTVDCNDFRIDGLAAGSESAAYGIQAANRQNITIRHCGIRGFRYGMLLSGDGHLVEDNRLDSNLYVGLYVSGNNNRVQRNRVYDTGGRPASNYGYGIIANADVIDNTVANVFAVGPSPYIRGIWVGGTGSVARDNVIRGIVADSGSVAGIQSNSAGIALIGNRISAATTTTGTGVIGGGLNTVCSGNSVINYTASYFSCDANSGNLALP